MNPLRLGGCQCGAIRFEVKGNPMRTYACHCTICQKQSGSAFGLSAVFPPGSFTVTKGSMEHFVRA
ncbi:MAG: GFA family protein, partial [Burkholderiales bacterium]|nr:GFA family protein [Burkholderiales bacterium]